MVLKRTDAREIAIEPGLSGGGGFGQPRPAWQTTGSIFGDWARIKAGIGFPSIPMGPSIDRRDAGFPSMPRISEVVPVNPPGNLPRVLKETIGRSFPQIKEVLQVPTVAAAPVLPRVRTSPPPQVRRTVGLPNVTNGGNMPSVTESLQVYLRGIIPGGSDIFDAGAAALGMFTPGTTVANVPAVGTGTISGSVPVVQSGGGMAPPPFSGGGACESDPRNNYVLKFSCGQWKWIKKQKRRRKRLASSSDINDLSKLKGVLGMGKAMETWIATHG